MWVANPHELEDHLFTDRIAIEGKKKDYEEGKSCKNTQGPQTLG